MSGVRLYKQIMHIIQNGYTCCIFRGQYQQTQLPPTHPFFSKNSLSGLDTTSISGLVVVLIASCDDTVVRWLDTRDNADAVVWTNAWVAATSRVVSSSRKGVDFAMAKKVVLQPMKK